MCTHITDWVLIIFYELFKDLTFSGFYKKVRSVKPLDPGTFYVQCD